MATLLGPLLAAMILAQVRVDRRSRARWSTTRASRSPMSRWSSMSLPACRARNTRPRPRPGPMRGASSA